MTMDFHVIATVQSGDHDPVEIRWYTGDDALQALAAFTQAWAQAHDTGTDVPESLRVRTLSVRVDVHTVNESTTPITERGIGGPCGRCGAQVYDVGLVLPFNADGTVHDGCTTFTVTRVQ